MSKSIAEMRAGKRAALPERTYEMCLAQSLVAEVEALELERDTELEAAALAANDQRGDGKVRKMGQGVPARVGEINARLEELRGEMREHTGILRLRAVGSGQWQRFIDENPAREDNSADEEIAYGTCSVSALLADLRSYVVAWNEDDLDDDEWDWVVGRAAPGDLKQICRLVVQMHEFPGAVPVGKSQSASSTTPASESASA